MTQIVPTITAATPADFATQLARLDFASRLHIDIADGDFAPARTVNLDQIYWDNFRENLPGTPESTPREIDLHLMLSEPIQWLHQIVALNPRRAIFHVESDAPRKNLPPIREHLAKFGIKFGVAILPETRVANVREIVALADEVLIFGGKLGFQGGTADLKQLEKIAQIREIWREVDEKNPAKILREIAWDGGANANNIREIARAGVDVVNVGAAIARSGNPETAYRDLQNLVK